MKKILFDRGIGETIRRAMIQSVSALLQPPDYQLTDELEEADFVVVNQVKTLEILHDFEKRFILCPMTSKQRPAAVPENVAIAGMDSLVTGLVSYVASQEAMPKRKRHNPPCSGKRILVVDDSLVHVNAAYEQLGNSYLLEVRTTYAQALAAMKSAQYDAILTDLLLPASVDTLSGDAIEKYAGLEMPLGMVLAFKAALHSPKVAVVTDKGHHDHPMSAALDLLSGRRIDVDGSTVIFSNTHGGGENGKRWNDVLNILLPLKI